MVHLEGLIEVLVSMVKRQSQTGVIFFSRAWSTITIQDKEIDEQNPGYVQLLNNTRPSYKNIFVSSMILNQKCA